MKYVVTVELKSGIRRLVPFNRSQEYMETFETGSRINNAGSSQCSSRLQPIPWRPIVGTRSKWNTFIFRRERRSVPT